MSDSRGVQPALGLGDNNIDPDILTTDVDHDFFDNPTEGGAAERAGERNIIPSSGAANNTIKCQQPAHLTRIRAAGERDEIDRAIERERPWSLSRNYDDLASRKELVCAEVADIGPPTDHSSTSTGIKVGEDAGGGVSLAVMYSTNESNATSPNYPRPKQCYLLQQRRRSLGSIKKCPQNPNNSSHSNGPPQQQGGGEGDQQFLPMNLNDCGLNGSYDCESGAASPPDSELSDSLDSDSEEIDSDDEEFVDMLQKYFDYIEQSSDYSDLTEVSPLSSTSTSPLPPLPATIAEGENADGSNVVLSFNPIADHSSDESVSEDGELDGYYDDDDDDDLPDVHMTQEGPYEEEEVEHHNNAALLNESRLSIGPAAAGEQDGYLFSSLATAALLVEENNYAWRKEDTNAVQVQERKTDVDEAISSFVEEPTVADADGFNKVGGADAPDLFMAISTTQADQSTFVSTDMAGDVDCATKMLSSCWIPDEGAVGGSSDEPEKETCGGGGSPPSATSSLTGSAGSSSNGRRPPRNYTFTPDQMRRIERENNVLLKKILDTQKKGHHHHHGKNGHALHRSRHATSAASLTRARQQKKIDHENTVACMNKC